MLTEIPLEQYAAVLDRCAEDALWEAHADRPPVDAFRVARRLRLRVASDETQPGRARFVRRPLSGGARLDGLIVLGREERPERRQWAVAHEIGEAIAHRVFATLDVSPDEAPPLERERVANALAGRLLAPRRWLMGVARESDADLFSLKEVFTTASHELIARRLLECRRDPLVVTVFDQEEVTWRRWTGPGAPPGVSSLEEECREQATRVGEPVWCEPDRGGDGATVARVRGWPIHEPLWRREILFTELFEP